MKIRKLRLQNFRGFEDKTFEFSDQFNVLIGDNGTGKTSILKALEVFLRLFFSQFILIDPAGTQKIIRRDDVRRVRYEKGKTLTLELQYPVILSCEGVLSDKEFGWTVGLKEDNLEKVQSGSLEVTGQLGKQIQDGEDVLLPLVACYGTGRLQETFDPDADERQRQRRPEWFEHGSRMQGYYRSVTSGFDEGLLMG